MPDVIRQLLDAAGILLSGMLTFLGTLGGATQEAILPVIILFIAGAALWSLTRGPVLKIVSGVLVASGVFALAQWLGMPRWAGLLFGIIVLGLAAAVVTRMTWKRSRGMALFSGIIVVMAFVGAGSVIDNNVDRIGRDLRSTTTNVTTFLKGFVNASTGSKEKSEKQKKNKKQKQEKKNRENRSNKQQ